jgi:hypothetical protein
MTRTVGACSSRARTQHQQYKALVDRPRQKSFPPVSFALGLYYCSRVSHCVKSNRVLFRLDMDENGVMKIGVIVPPPPLQNLSIMTSKIKVVPRRRPKREPSISRVDPHDSTTPTDTPVLVYHCFRFDRASACRLRSATHIELPCYYYYYYSWRRRRIAWACCSCCCCRLAPAAEQNWESPAVMA